MGKMLIIKGATYTAPSGGSNSGNGGSSGGGGISMPSTALVHQAVEAYLEASGVDANWESKLRTLVSGLMSAGIWDRLTGFYPLLGSTAESMAVNLRNPAESPITSEGNTGNINYAADSGVKYTARGGYLKIEPTWATLNDYHLMGLYTDEGFTINQNALFSPLSQGASVDGDVAMFYDGTNVVFRGQGNKGILAPTTVSGIGDSMAASCGPAGTSIYHGGARQAHSQLDGGLIANTRNNAPIVLLGYSTGSVTPSVNVRLRCCSFGQSLSNEQMERLLQLAGDFKPF